MIARSQIPFATGMLCVVILLCIPLVYSGANYDYVMHLFISAFFYAILASSWSLLAGSAGQFSFGHMAFMAIGAYTAGLLNNYLYLSPVATTTCIEVSLGTNYLVLLDPIGVSAEPETCLDRARALWVTEVDVTRMPVLLGILLGIVIGGSFGWAVGALVLRLRSAYLALFTLGFSEIVRAVLNAELNVTRGPTGLELTPLFPSGITLFGFEYGPYDKLPVYYVMLLLLIASLAFITYLLRSRFGLFVRSLREDEEAAASLGVDTVRYKVTVFAVTAMLAAGAGAVQAHYLGIITPNIMIILQMGLVVAMAVVGGVESAAAAAAGAVLLYFALEILRNNFSVAGYTVDMTTWRLVAFGLIVMLTLRFCRNGLIFTAIEWCTRGQVAAETVAARQRPATESEPTTAPPNANSGN